VGRGILPTIFRMNGFRVYFYSREPDEPPHVHIDRAGATAKAWLDPVVLASSAGFSARDIADVLRLVRSQRETLLEAWNDFFGQDGDQ
jgi:hypothetical protein